MQIGEVILVLMIFITVPVTIWLANRTDDRKVAARELKEDLEAVLATDDYRDLDAFLIVYGGRLDKKTEDAVRSRRTDLYIEAHNDVKGR